MSFLADFWEKLKKGDYRAIDIALTAALTLGATISTGISIYEVYLKRQTQAAAREVSQLALASGEVYGVDVVLDDLKRKLLRPVQLRDWYSRGLWRLPKGVLLYGPSGTGKTSLAKVIAKAGQFRFLHLSAAAISDKWIGEGPKRVRAAFSLAHRVAPCIIFVDEVDTLLSRRTDANQPGGHEAYDQVKTEFMSQWDGLLSEAAQLSGVVVMGATNRRQALDPAVLRRFTLQYEVPAPGLPQRRAILLGYLRRHVGPKRDIKLNTTSTSSSSSGGTLIKGPQQKAHVDSPAAGQTAAAEAAAPATMVTADNEPGTEPDAGAEGEAGLPLDAADDHNDDDETGADSDGGSGDDVDAPGLDWLAAATEGLTGAHLRELCHRAALLVLDEVPEEQLKSLHPDRGGVEVLRALCRHDFEVALRLQSGAPLAG
eukprot:XP_001696340.1 AAA-ATPase domain family protein [Chlamydomonas reinhardtii]